VVFLIRGVGWLADWPVLDHVWLRNPFDPAVDVDGELTSLLTGAGGRGSALIITVVAAAGVILVLVMATIRPPSRGRPLTARRAWLGAVVTVLAAVQAFVLAVLLPDYRVIATVGYTPVLLARQLFEKDSPYTLGDAYTPVTVAMLTMTIAGLAFAAAAVGFRRRLRSACPRCGRADRPSAWTSPAAAVRWGRWATVVAIVIPVGYAATRWAWALGIPLGVRQSLLDELGAGVWMGAFLGTLAVGGAVLTAGLVRPWGEVFPRWIPGLRGRRVPIPVAVVPALFVAVITTSAGLMFLRIAVTGRIPDTFGGTADVAAWLPEMFWSLWGAALAAAAIGYWLRRRGQCPDCGRGASASRR
jgi:ribosomal protein S27AE/NADH:ubiquinone oxidoreductase subunit 6 (subunit J)